jgi:hypothetical protein
MIKKNTARKKVQKYHSDVFTKISEIDVLIKKHCEIGFDEMEVFITASQYLKIKTVLEKNGYYVSSSRFAAMPDCLAMYVSWNHIF